MNYTSSKGILGMLGEIVSRLGDDSITTNLIEAFNPESPFLLNLVTTKFT